MRDLLHDEKDALQFVREKWRHDVEGIRREMVSIIRAAEDPRDVFVEANVLAADALAQRTTDAALIGLEFGARKVAKGGIGAGEDAPGAEQESEAP